MRNTRKDRRIYSDKAIKQRNFKFQRTLKIGKEKVISILVLLDWSAPVFKFLYKFNFYFLEMYYISLMTFLYLEIGENVNCF